ncbi:MAG: tRNA pseudouridine synthase [Gammaproteobacteria bacterium]|nr:tRNA pseudouridine synthase [Gammaproteobacteria bacterium]
MARGTLRAEPEDFVVEEDLGFGPSGAGQHVLLKVRKRNANTQWVVRELAKICGCHPRDIGYAGLKDRRAIAIQWLTVPQSRLTLDVWRTVREPDFEVLEADAHSRKLPRGALAGNRFMVRIRNVEVEDVALAARIAEISRRGVPNYFGPQRFGRDGANLARIADGLRALRPQERGFVLSAARSLVFNAILAERARDGSWERLEVGDIANLDGRGSIFPVETLDQTLSERCEQLDLHPTGPMWGKGAPPTRLRVSELEARLAAEFPQPCALTAEAGMEQERRALRLAVRELTWEREAAAIVIRFRLMRGSFATMVLHEIVESEALADEDNDA